MKMTEWFLAQLEAEAVLCRRALERVPEGRNDWKPHEKSMALGYLATLVGTMPGWVAMMVNQDGLDLGGPRSAEFRPKEVDTTQERIEAFEASVAKGREALTSTTDEHLMKPWKFSMGGRALSENPRYVMIRDAVFGHLAHHRGQLTVYLRLNGVPVPSLYGPSADEGPR